MLFLNTKIFRSHHQRKETIILLNRKYNIRRRDQSNCTCVGVYLASMHSAGCCADLAGAKPGGSGMPV